MDNNTLTEEAKALAPLIPTASELTKLAEWKAAKQLLQLKIREREETLVHRTKYNSMGEVALDQGICRGLQLAIDLIDTGFPLAMEKMKKTLDSQPK